MVVFLYLVKKYLIIYSCDLEIGTLDKLAQEGELMVYKHFGDWMCMDTLRDMQYLDKLLKNGRAFWKIWKN